MPCVIGHEIAMPIFAAVIPQRENQPTESELQLFEIHFFDIEEYALLVYLSTLLTSTDQVARLLSSSAAPSNSPREGLGGRLRRQ